MAFSYPLIIGTDWVGYEQITFRQRHVTSLSMSPFTYKQQVVQHPGMMWAASIKIPPVNKDLALEWIGFLGKLRGRYGTFLLGDPNGVTPEGLAASSPGTPLVMGGGQTGDTLVIDGCGANKTDYLKKGDYFQLGSGSTSRLYMSLENESSNASGQVTIRTWPDINPSPSDNDAVTLTNPRGVFRLASDEVSWTSDNMMKYGLSFDAIGVV